MKPRRRLCLIGVGEEEAQPVAACGCFTSRQNILTDRGEKQMPLCAVILQGTDTLNSCRTF